MDGMVCKTGVAIEPGYVQSLDGGSGRGNEKRRIGRVRLGSERIYILVYADDMVLIADEKEGMRCMIERLGWYLERKGLELNAKKLKMGFRKRDDRE